MLSIVANGWPTLKHHWLNTLFFRYNNKIGEVIGFICIFNLFIAFWPCNYFMFFKQDKMLMKLIKYFMVDDTQLVK